MAGNKLSAREAALIAQARADLDKTSSAQAGAPAIAPGAKRDALMRPSPPAARAGQAAPTATIEPVAPMAAAPATSLGPAERIAALMAAARAETERQRQRQRQKMLYLWVPAAFISVIGLWTLLWMWQKL